MKGKEKKNKKSIIILIVLLIVIILCLIGYICYDTFSSMNDTKSDNETTEVVDKTEKSEESEIKHITIDSPEVKAAMKAFEMINITPSELYNSKGYNIDNISNYDLVSTGLHNLVSNSNDGSGLSKYVAYCISEKSQLKDAIPVSELNKGLDKYLDKKITVDTIKGLNKGASYSMAQYEVSDIGIILEGDKMRLIGPCGAIFQGEPYQEKKTIAAEMSNDELYVYEKVAFGIYDDASKEGNPVASFYKEFSGKTKVSSGLKDWNEYNTYKYTFKISNNSYYFQKYELSDK